jgi:hypothetical protein
MPKSAYALALFVCLAGPASAAEEVPSDASLKQLLEVTQSRKLLDSSMAQLDGVLQSSMQKALQGQEADSGQQRILDGYRGKAVGLIRQEMGWETLEPEMLDIYRKSFSQKEVDGMLAFYRTEAGKAVIDKMPLVMQYSMQLVQERIGTLAPKLNALQQETLDKLREERPAK